MLGSELPSVLALALGNPLRGDDGAGAAIARGLDASLPGVEVIEAVELLPEHAEVVARADIVLFLDAAAEGTPGEVRVEPVEPRAARTALGHALQPGELLALAQALHGRAPPAALVTIAAKSFAFGEGLSPEVERALPAARAVAARTQRSVARPPGPWRGPSADGDLR